jgi:hypothetical protein
MQRVAQADLIVGLHGGAICAVHHHMSAGQWVTMLGVISLALRFGKACIAQIAPSVTLLSRHCTSCATTYHRIDEEDSGV